MKAIVVIPVYEPETCLGKLVDRILDLGYEALIVNDGSDWQYDDVFEDLTGDCSKARKKSRKRGCDQDGAGLYTAVRGKL